MEDEYLPFKLYTLNDKEKDLKELKKIKEAGDPEKFQTNISK